MLFAVVVLGDWTVSTCIIMHAGAWRFPTIPMGKVGLPIAQCPVRVARFPTKPMGIVDMCRIGQCSDWIVFTGPVALGGGIRGVDSVRSQAHKRPVFCRITILPGGSGG